MKYCKACEQTLTSGNFYKDKSQKDGLRRICKSCTKKVFKIYLDNNRERINETNRKSYYNNKETRRKNQRKYELKIREAARTDKIIHSKILLKQIKSRSQRNGITCTITYKDIPIPDKCPILDIALKRNREKMAQNSATVDRIIPSRGYIPSNVIVVSLKANAIKQNATPDDILKVGNFYKELINDNHT